METTRGPYVRQIEQFLRKKSPGVHRAERPDQLLGRLGVSRQVDSVSNQIDRLPALACEKVQLRQQIAPCLLVLAGSLIQVRHRVPDSRAIGEGDLESLGESELSGQVRLVCRSRAHPREEENGTKPYH